VGEVARKTYGRRLKQAVHLLFFKHHRLPGVRGWELRRMLGPEWLSILEVLDNRLKPLDLEVRRVFDERGEGSLEEARYYITLRGGVEQRTAKTMGWRIDDIAGLAVAVAYIAARGGKAPRGDVERVLGEKLPGWRVRVNLERYIQDGYLSDEEGVLTLGWRGRAEIDVDGLMERIMRSRVSEEELPKKGDEPLNSPRSKRDR
jgi:hypothetical protein